MRKQAEVRESQWGCVASPKRLSVRGRMNHISKYRPECGYGHASASFNGYLHHVCSISGNQFVSLALGGFQLKQNIRAKVPHEVWQQRLRYETSPLIGGLPAMASSGKLFTGPASKLRSPDP